MSETMFTFVPKAKIIVSDAEAHEHTPYEIQFCPEEPECTSRCETQNSSNDELNNSPSMSQLQDKSQVATVPKIIIITIIKHFILKGIRIVHMYHADIKIVMFYTDYYSCIPIEFRRSSTIFSVFIRKVKGLNLCI